MSIANDMYNGLGSIGKFRASTSVISGLVIASCLSCMAMWYMMSPELRVKAIVENSRCTDDSQCAIDISYTVNGVLYKSTVYDTSPLPTSTTIEVTVNESNPHSVTYSKLPKHTMVSGSVAMASVIAICVILNFALTQKSPAYAALQGIDTIGSVFRR